MTAPSEGGDNAAALARPVTTTAMPRAGLWATTIGPRLAAVALGAACIGWSASPLGHGGLARAVLIISIAAVSAGALRLVFADIPEPQRDFALPGYLHAWLLFLAMLHTLAWEETAVVGTLWLEVQHQARPWHTAVLGVGLTAYLLAVHIAESGAVPASLLRRQWKLLAAGGCLLVLGAASAFVPAAAFGAGAAIMRVLAVVAVVAVAVLVLPA